MVDELAPLSLVEAARRLGTTPFDLIRVAVAHGEMPSGTMRFDAARMERLYETGAFARASADVASPRAKAIAEQSR